MDSSIPLVACIALIVAAAWRDLRDRRIPNRLVFPGMLLALLLHVLLPSGGGLLFALQGLGLGLLLMLPLYVLRAAGAGDVKLVAMVGGFLGVRDLLGALFCIFIIGGLLAVAVAWKNGVWRRTLDNILSLFLGVAIKLGTRQLPSLDALPAPAAKLPYGVAIALGTIAYVAWQHFPGVRS